MAQIGMFWKRAPCFMRTALCSVAAAVCVVLATAHDAQAQEAKDLYGDALPAGAVARLGSVRFRHPASITMLAVAPTGDKVITLGQQSSLLRSCDLKTGSVTDFLELGSSFGAAPTSSRRTSLAFADEGKRLIVVSANYVQAFDAETKTPLWKTSLDQGFVMCSAVSPDGKWMALVQTRDNGRLAIVNTETGKISPDIPRAGNSPTDVAFTHDGKAVSVSTHNQTEGLRSWSLETGKELPPIKEVHQALSISYSPDGRWLALGHSQPSVSLLDLKTRTVKPIGGFPSSVRWVEFTPDGKRLLAYDNTGMITVINPEEAKELRKINSGPSQALPALAMDGKAVVTAFGNVVDAWNIETGEPSQPFDGHRSIVSHIAVHPDGQLVATFGQDNTLRLWDRASSKQLHVQRRPIYGAFTIAFSPTGEHLVWANTATSIEFLDVAVLTKKKQAATATAREVRGNQFSMFVLSDDGRLLVANNAAAGGAQIWDLSQKNATATQAPATFGAQSAPLGFSPDGRLSATQFSVDGSGRQVVIADIARSREITRLISPAGQPMLAPGVFAGTRLFASRSKSNVALWDVLSGKSVANVNVGDAAAATTTITCSTDGRILAWAESDPARTIRLFDSLTNRELAKFNGHMGPVQFLRISTEAERPVLLSGSQDSTTLLWDLGSVMDEVGRTTPKLAAQPADQVWADLGAEDAAAMHRASWLLIAADDEAVSLLAERLQPAPIDPELGAKIDQLVAQMDDDRFSAREQASQKTAELGEAAEPFLQEALKSTTSAEVRHRIRRLLADIAGKPLVLSADQQRSIRAVQILEHIGGNQASDVLQRLTQGQPSARLTQEAKNAVVRLEQRSGKK